MAAYAALLSLMKIVQDIEHHHSPPITLDKQQVESLTEIVTFLQEFLEAYNFPVADDDGADPLEMRIADAAYAAEDVIESHILDMIEFRRSTNNAAGSVMSRFSCFRTPKKPQNFDADAQIKFTNFRGDLQQVIQQMDHIKKAVMEIDTEKAVVHDQRRRNEVSSSDYLSSSSSFMLCSDDVLMGIMEKLIGYRLDLQVIPVTGMGGIGKTTLAKNIYTSPLIKEHFDICVWVTISQQYNTRELLYGVLSQATNKRIEELSDMREDKLGLELYQYLFGRRFLIVMDDMWSIDAWETIHNYLPNNENGSRILVTTRLSQLSSQLNSNYSLQMKFLDEASSWDLFSKTVFGEKSFPLELKKIGKKIAYNCKGLPLSIVVVGGLLKNMDRTPQCWESISNNFSSLVNLENDKHCLRLLKMSYNHLSAHLKPCFLYFGVFKEDERIRVSSLIKLWIAEGFLKSKNDESLKTTAKRFLKDLVNRNLILADTLGSTGNIKFCKIHDLMRDLCLTEAEKDGFYHVIGRGSPRCISSQRRVVIRSNTSKKKLLKELNSMPHVRSIISQYSNIPSCRNLRFLRTFHSYYETSVYYKNQDIDQNCRNFRLCQHVNLRYLAIRGSVKSSFLSPLILLWNLQTLIVFSTSLSMPFEIWKMAQLRHIEFVEWHRWSNLLLPDPSDLNDVVILENVEILKGVKNFKLGEEIVKRIPNIKKLKIGSPPWQGDDPYCLITNVELLSKLESLAVCYHIGYKEAPLIQKITFPHSLKSLCISMFSDVKWEEMLEKIGRLPLLEKLEFREGHFRASKWEIVEGQFPCLKYLCLSLCDGPIQWTVEESSFVLPRLEQLRLCYVDQLEEIPYEIGHIPTLQNICVYGCRDSVVKSAKKIVDEQVELQGEELSFHVEVLLYSKNVELQNLATPNFKVETIFDSYAYANAYGRN